MKDEYSFAHQPTVPLALASADSPLEEVVVTANPLYTRSSLLPELSNDQRLRQTALIILQST
ncbi:MAG: hypothetical protein KME57_10920 [Scytonema hyalinum WJT4-NPBG1]|nr:hypothetical protein [Scytonema hyalinum WJT4-NPBG1]